MDCRIMNIERGEIIAEEDGGYIIKSLDRDGIETPPLQPAGNETYQVGAVVCYILFWDGTGRIIYEV